MKTTPQQSQYLTIECGWCGKKHSANMAHYDVLQGACGHYFWALQPRRGGPLVLFPHPRLNTLFDAGLRPIQGQFMPRA